MSGGCFSSWRRGLWTNIKQKGFSQMSVYEAISLMLLFGTFMLALLTYIDHHNKK
ncbi:putative holin-like toxin [Lactobacillus intestinalis]|uniref:putative holin-like toxin n=1 Tax=Lactobacillus intestinalis TaxID=151781 RepID=UPI00350E3A10